MSPQLNRLCVVALFAGSAAVVGAQNAAQADRCQSLSALSLPDVQIERAAPGATARGITAAHCRVEGVIGREIRFAVLLPERWNHRFVMGGGGGFVGTVENQAAASVNDGYATAGTDTGHRGTEISASWALNDDERKVNYAHAAVHRTTEVAKAIVRAYYSIEAAHAYFSGCSNGGRQAMMEAQRYPDDFDGIVAGAPALDFTGIATEFIRDTQAVYPDPRATATSPVTADNLKLLESRVLAACDAQDGVADGVIQDPRTCRFDVNSIPACKSDQPAADCFTAAQRKVIKTLYSDVRIGGKAIRPAQPFGGEAERGGWQIWKTGPFAETARAGNPDLRAAFGTEFFKYFVFNDPKWDYSQYSLQSAPRDTVTAARLLNATNTNLDAFKRRGHKLILWHGWADPGLNPLGTIEYYERVRARDPNAAAYARLFMLPGVLHCEEGGAAPNHVDWLGAISDWVEQGHAPERIIAAKETDGHVIRTRPLCAYPSEAVYAGSGNTDTAASFTCQAPAAAGKKPARRRARVTS